VPVIGKCIDFLRHVRTELGKVTWPTRKDAYGSSCAVIVLVMIVAVFLWAVDLLLSTGIKALLGG
jgi:preprotein translocase subunit SecE